MKPTLAVICGDTHFGGFTAVSPPQVATESGQVVKANAAQGWLYHFWQQDWQAVKERARGKRLIVIHAGDIVEGEHHDALAHLPDVKDQETLAVEMLTPVRNLAEALYLVKGTEAHAGNQHMSERRIARELAARLSFRLRLNVDGCLIDVAHHSTGTARNIGLQVIEDCLLDGEPIPRYVFRGHRHAIKDTGREWPFMRVLTIPCWQLKTSYGWKIATNRRAPIGMVILEDGEIEIIRHTPKLDPIVKA